MLDEAGTIWKRMLAHMMLSRAERQQFYALPAQGPRREEWLMGRLAAKDAARDWYRLHAGVDLTPADVAIHRDSQGNPWLPCSAMPQLRPPPTPNAPHRRRP